MIAYLCVAQSPPIVPTIVADWLLLTLSVETGNVALLEPAGTMTLAGTVTAVGLSFARSTRTPPAGAAAVSVTVPVAGSPPTTSPGLMATEESVLVLGGGGGGGGAGGGGGGAGGGGGGGAELILHPERVTFLGVAEPSSTSTLQSAGLVNGSRSILKFPPASLVPIATPSTVIVRFAIDVPSMRSLEPLISARVTFTVASAAAATTAAIASSERAAMTRRNFLRTVSACSTWICG